MQSSAVLQGRLLVSPRPEHADAAATQVDFALVRTWTPHESEAFASRGVASMQQLLEPPSNAHCVLSSHCH